MSRSQKRRRRGQLGQVAVEVAIVMPLFVFLVAGIIQLALMHQARSMTKYAAFRAARAGIMNSADRNAMIEAAFDAVQPTIRQGDLDNRERLLRHVEVSICSPTRSLAREAKNKQYSDNPNLSFDEPFGPCQTFEARKLAVQVTYYYPMFIPFADMIISFISRGEQAAHEVLFKNVARMGTEETGVQGPRGNEGRIQELREQNGTPYVVPIRANYALHIQSDLVVDNMPTNSECVRL